ncbi:MAG TPA: hypothetical protein VJM32_06745 [Candidatus Saccharimonadales bacterium]|nr:hypothetical protein [Candidatus Saccharimonadales bacterium]
MAKSHLVTTLSLFIASTILLSSVHATQLLGATDGGEDGGRAKKSIDSSKIEKIDHDLHHHSDKTGSQLIKDASDNGKYVDSRSLRLSRHKKDIVRHRLDHWKHAIADIALTHHLFI